ncbi:hypothetical protein GKZ89_04490 [Bacillus mangrovi]|uniref:DksA C4-type domain-containing protein n=2 Tax=Metabacillus mangrovi TaxID=1491830 RepID=A0A7X2S3E4_9BACI|nr:hypothetical protein [Metabacillus mangrovi]
MREELRERLFSHSFYDSSSGGTMETLLVHVKEELHDVEHALNKMNSGMYGICEETGQALPLESLKYLPTARCLHDFSFKDQYERKALPFAAAENHHYSGYDYEEIY